jgi:transcriptional regulator GlxA family with amidase domain
MVKQMKAAILVAEGVQELDFIGVVEVFGASKIESPEKYIEPIIVGVKPGPVKCSHGTVIVPHEVFKGLSEYDIVVVPGGGLEELSSEPVLEALKKAFSEGKMIASICIGAFALAKAGLLKDRKATTYKTYVKKLAKYGAILVMDKVTIDGNVITGGGPANSIEVGLAIVRIMIGEIVAEKIADYLDIR